MLADLPRRALAEAVGALLLTACVVGSGIMAERLSNGNAAVALLANTLAAAWRISLWIGAAYWFTASTSFANPAITIGRSLSDSFAGIRPGDVPAFIGAQTAGGFAGMLLLRLFAERRRTA
jgi:glycerol uptake facilitator-like aquaporin